MTRPLVFAHRGGSCLMPENTWEAFENGLALGAHGIELDCRLSRDGVVMVHHDATLERTTDGRGPLAPRAAGELERLDAAYWFAPERGYPLRGNGIRIPRLADVLARTRDAPIIVELKGDDPALGVAAVEVARRAGAMHRVCFAGYSREILRAVRRADVEAITSACFDEVRVAFYKSWIGWRLSRVPYRAFQVPERAGVRRIVSPRFIRAARRAGVAVHVWTVDEPSDMTRLLDWGVNGIITDRPDVAVVVVRGWREAKEGMPA